MNGNQTGLTDDIVTQTVKLAKRMAGVKPTPISNGYRPQITEGQRFMEEWNRQREKYEIPRN